MGPVDTRASLQTNNSFSHLLSQRFMTEIPGVIVNMRVLDQNEIGPPSQIRTFFSNKSIFHDFIFELGAKLKEFLSIFFPGKFYIRGRSILFQKMQHSSDFRLWPKTERGNICDDFYFSCLNHQSTILVSLFPISDPKLVIRMAQETTKRFSNYESGMVDQQFSLSTVYDIYISRLLPQRET
jgi:hypothetical protein